MKIVGVFEFVLMITFSILITSCEKTKDEKDEKVNYKIVQSKNMKENRDGLLDINKATKEEMVAYKIRLKIINGILEYRKHTGGFQNIKELKRIKGVGDATYNTIQKKFKIENEIKKNNFNINTANSELLIYYGFDKKEITTIQKYIKANGRIKNNLDLMNVLDKKRYEEFKSLIIYENF
ncbi:helix-hairpin-helix domain-containing protein [Fusobacterium sp. PH5-44]|uniref:helix-hairpin-helix domain-containing protein n=1 Tax=unclassified Fusobacterium TaxID=2648384 RepID=UPI003D1E0811